MDISKLVFSDAALDAIDNGAWVGDLPGLDGVRLKVRGMQSEVVRKSVEAKQAKQRLKNGGTPLTDAQHKKIMQEVIGETVLIDWEGFTNNGEPLPYNAEQAKAWTSSRNGERLTNLALFAAQKIDTDAQSFVEAAVKN